jgi:hypothetical protein
MILMMAENQMVGKHHLTKLEPRATLLEEIEVPVMRTPINIFGLLIC